MKKTITQLFEHWARIEDAKARGAIGQPTQDVIGKAMSGVRGTNCPKCHGKGKVPGAGRRRGIVQRQMIRCRHCRGTGRVDSMDPVMRQRTKPCPDCKDDQGIPRGEVNGKTCITCRGRGKIVRVDYKHNPATIPATGTGYWWDSDADYQAMDNIISHDLTDAQRGVVIAEYTWKGQTIDKAKRLRISPATYRKRLERARLAAAARWEALRGRGPRIAKQSDTMPA